VVLVVVEIRVHAKSRLIKVQKIDFAPPRPAPSKIHLTTPRQPPSGIRHELLSDDAKASTLISTTTHICSQAANCRLDSPAFRPRPINHRLQRTPLSLASHSERNT
jgi:hypothetical protein